MRPTLAGSVPIEIVMSKDSPVYVEVADTIERILKANKTSEYRIVRHTVDKPYRGVKFSPHITVGIGKRASAFLLERKDRVPVLSTLIPRLSFDDMLREYGSGNPHPEKKVFAVYMDQSPARHVALAKRLSPQWRNMVLPIGPEREALSEEYADAALKNGISVKAVIVAGAADFIDAIEGNSPIGGAILSVFDPKIISPTTTKQMLYYSYRHRIPLFGYSSSLVSAGALASIYSTPHQVAVSAADLIEDMLRLGENQPVRRIYPDGYTISCNPMLFDYMLALDRTCPTSVD